MTEEQEIKFVGWLVKRSTGDLDRLRRLFWREWDRRNKEQDATIIPATRRSEYKMPAKFWERKQ